MDQILPLLVENSIEGNKERTVYPVQFVASLACSAMARSGITAPYTKPPISAVNPAK
jgi:hypothetical protein